MASDILARTVYPRDDIAFIGRTPQGQPFRWAEDEHSPENVISNISLSDEMPGGWKQAGGQLARNPQRAYPDLVPYSEIQAILPGGRVVWEGSLDKLPDVSGQQQSISPAMVGYQSMLEDNQAVVVGFITKDTSKWGDPPALRKYNLDSGNYPNQGPEMLQNTSGVTALRMQVEGAWTSPYRPLCEAWFDCGPTILAKAVYGEWNNGNSNTLFELYARFSTDQASASYEGSGDAYGATTGNIAWLPVTPRRFVYFEWIYTTTPAGAADVTFSVDLINLTVVGNTTVPLSGTLYGNLSMVSKYMLEYLVNNFTDLKANAGEMDCDEYPIVNAWYDNPDTAANVVKDLIKYEFMDWFVYRGKKFDYKRPGTYGKKWRSSVKGMALNETGLDSQRIWKSITVQWTDQGTGEIRTAGPPGTLNTVTSEQLENKNVSNPAVSGKRLRKALLAINVPITETTAIELGRRFLEEAELIDHSGSATLSHYVMDDKGVFYPVSVVKSGDWISPTDASNSGYRKIINKSYNHTQRQCQIDLDAPASGMEALLERLNASLIGVV